MKKQPTTTSSVNRKEQVVGILTLFVCASIGFQSFIVWTGLDDLTSKALTLPALLWVAIVLVQRFTK